MSPVYVLGIDPGFASVGYVVVNIASENLTPVKMGLIETVKSANKRNVRASEDNLERAKEIADALQKLIKDYNIRLICAETMSYPRNSGAAAKMAMCWGVIAALAHQHSIPVTQASPQEVKKAVCGKKDASKEEVQAAVAARFPVVAAHDKDGDGILNVAKSKQEHPYDALAVVVACSTSEVFLFARRMAKCEASTG